MKTMKTEIIPERLERFNSPDFHLRRGVGEGVGFRETDVCLMQAVDWLTGGKGTSDAPECAAPIITRYCIRLNDSWLFKEHRDILKPFAVKIVGTRNPELDRKRAYIAADYAVRAFAPIWLRADPKKRFDEQAVTLENLPRIVDKKSAENARDEARKVGAYAAADAADASFRSGPRNWNAAAAYAAAAADAAAVAYGITELLRTKSLECLQALIEA